MRRAAQLLVLGTCSVLAAAVTPGAGSATVSAYMRQAPVQQFYLPEGLTEVSGIAMASNDTVFAHDDNYGIVYEVALTAGKTVKAFALGDPTVKAEFEDIATRGSYVYLLTNDGRIFEAPVGANRTRVMYNAYNTGAGAHCETEGLANGAADGEFLILCKKMRETEFKDHLVIYLWNLRDRQPVSTPWLNVSLDGLVPKLDQANFHPSALVWRRDKGTLIILSAKGHSAIEIDQQGRPVDRVKLDKDLHPEPKGMAMMSDGRLVISDMGSVGHGKISVYAVPR